MTSAQEVIAFARKAAWHFRRYGMAGARRYLKGRGINIPSFEQLGWNVKPNPVKLNEWAVPPVDQPTHKITVGVIADEFFRFAFAYEWDALYLDSSSWLAQLEETTIDFLFVDSAWQMERGETWKYQILGESAPRAELRELVAYCKERGIPTVFWNREDPPHYGDAIETAKLFDYVYTTDSTRVPFYKNDLGHDRVAALPFAAQVAIHNPMAVMDGYEVAKKRDVAFAGAYYGMKYPERKEQMDLLLGAALDPEKKMATGLDIFARDMGGGKDYRFPRKFRAKIRGSLTYRQTLSAYRHYKAFINVNSVVTSPTMASMRLFEVPACGTPIVSTPTPATANFFSPQMVAMVETPEQAQFQIEALTRNKNYSDRMAYLAQGEIWKKHTYTHRVDQILRDLGLESKLYTPPTVAPMISTVRPAQLEHVLETLAAQRDVQMQPIVGTHGFAASDEIQAKARELGLDVMWIENSRELSLGDVYNRLIERVDADYIAKMDDDDFYGADYLFDSLLAARYSRAELVGKQAHFMYLEDEDVTVLRFPTWENRYTSWISGPTMVARADVMKELGFASMTLGEDSDFLQRVIKSGGKVYSAQRFGFAQMRKARANHTWEISSAEVISTGKISHWGRPNETEMPSREPWE
ncbi:spore maturation protein CgeB [Arcanobacterium wilhelmae]|uniref:Spore maturation protein CgeB n=1 Tax=Arcanobacterium wilhelmae TaxID=1803177 RepID=A0ABT9NBY6_9ACTO|nr:glycosyltransferase [Arcanobacterium wilhelmae]MDP9801230.1 spore maturation protein CgeB [Arcanobacterium wilhelmae]WFN90579.1 glycosyltransferase [Arcanobacterium wilhelmae]